MEYSELSSSAKLCWARLAQYAGENGKCFPGQEKLAEDLGLSKIRVIQLIKELEEKQFIEIERPTGKDRLFHKNNQYFFLLHPIFKNHFTSGHIERYTSGGIERYTSINKIIINKDNHKLLPVDADASDKLITLGKFEKFWKLYPRKVDKGKALTTWKRLCQRPPKDKPTWKVIKLALLKQANTPRWQDKKFIPHPTTWLNQSRWLDDPEQMINYNEPRLDLTTAPFHNTKCIVEPEKLLSKREYKQCYLPAQEWTQPNNAEAYALSTNICALIKWVDGNQKKPPLPRREDEDSDYIRRQRNLWTQIIPNGCEFTAKYVEWLKEQTWLKDHSLNLFTPHHSLVERFRHKHQNEIGYDIFTGKEL